ncbi:hypothetical protein AVEN_216781-1 [Araneus ventricosus]|uniref:Uncharacterized protein n=1 Tax=Araneus ventricosus TaxID=182803 RepID=A0A4Y2II95_ARAVE|nr:hypothetical protein AVEN_216781-1 [Araneus ventricosus]
MIHHLATRVAMATCWHPRGGFVFVRPELGISFRTPVRKWPDSPKIPEQSNFQHYSIRYDTYHQQLASDKRRVKSGSYPAFANPG